MEIIHDKECRVCGLIKEVKYFFKAKVNSDGYENICKLCKKNKYSTLESRQGYSKKYHADNREKANKISRDYYSANKEKSVLDAREYRINNRERLASEKRTYRLNHPERERTAQRKYRKNNKNKLSKMIKNWRDSQPAEYFLKVNEKKRNSYRKNPSIRKKRALSVLAYKNRQQKLKTDYWLRCLLRLRILNFFSSGKERKNHNTINLLGTDYNVVIKYLNNLGYDRNKHDLDHIVPLSVFDIRDENHQLIMFHYLNLKPEDPYYNRYIKRNKLTSNWKLHLKQIGLARNIDVTRIIKHIENKIDNRKVAILHG